MSTWCSAAMSMCSRVRFITSVIGPEKMSSPNRMTTRWSQTASISESWCDETMTVRPFAPEVAEEPPDLHDPRRVEPVRRLVEDEQLGVGQQRRGDAEALLHAEREALDRLPVPADEADLCEHGVHALERQAAEAGERYEVGPGRQAGDERRALDQGPDPCGVGLRGVDRRAEDGCAAGGRPDQAQAASG